MTTVVVSGSGGNIGTNVVRAINKWANDLTVIGTETNPYYRHLSITDETYEIPHAGRDQDVYLDQLSAVFEATDADVFIPTNVLEITVVGAHRDRFDVETVLPDESTIDLFTNKWSSYETWDDAGLPVPESVLLESPSDVERAFDRIPTEQVWVRGAAVNQVTAIPGRRFDDPGAVRRWIKSHEGWGEFTASEYLPGTDCSWLGVYRNGELVASQGRERLDYAESDEWGSGAPTVSRTVSRTDLNETGREAVESVTDPHGVFFADMREDYEGQLRITEVNPGRLGTTTSLFFPKAGFNVPELIVQIALGDPTLSYPTTNVLEPGLHFIRKLDCDPVTVPGEEINA